MTKSANGSSVHEIQRSSYDRKAVILSRAKNPSELPCLRCRQIISDDETNQLRKAKLKRTKSVILTLSLSKGKDPHERFVLHHRQPLSSEEPNQLRQAKLKRTKFVILSEAEGPAFLSLTKMWVPHVSILRRGIARHIRNDGYYRLQNEYDRKAVILTLSLSKGKNPNTFEPDDSFPGFAYGCPRFAQLTWVSRRARPFKGWQ